MMKVEAFIEKLRYATSVKTLYIMGCFGAPMNAANKARYTKNYAYNKQASRTKKINSASGDTFGFDCVCLIKGILWGWTGDKSRVYGGASYASNGVPDIGSDTMMTAKHTSNISSDFSKLEVGELVWLPGHIGVYVGGGDVIECSPAWKDGVQVTKLSQRKWTKHGKLKYLEYPKKAEAKKYTVLLDILGYYTSADAKAGLKGNWIVKAGDYFIFNEANGMINVSSKQDTAGYWINPTDNVIKPKEPTPEEPKEEPIIDPPKEGETDRVNQLFDMIIAFILAIKEFVLSWFKD